MMVYGFTLKHGSLAIPLFSSMIFSAINIHVSGMPNGHA